MAKATAKREAKASATAGGTTAERLVEAAAGEFAEHGFAGTDSNRIARRAGFAPQTFYRWFDDKTAIFVAVYRRWQDEELAVLQRLVGERAASSRIADRVIEHHAGSRLFRRSLRQLALEEPLVRRARTESRRRQIDAVRALGSALKPERIAATLLQIERLSDAVAEGEFDDLGLDDRTVRTTLARLVDELRG